MPAPFQFLHIVLIRHYQRFQAVLVVVWRHPYILGWIFLGLSAFISAAIVADKPRGRSKNGSVGRELWSILELWPFGRTACLSHAIASGSERHSIGLAARAAADTLPGLGRRDCLAFAWMWGAVKFLETA